MVCLQLVARASTRLVERVDGAATGSLESLLAIAASRSDDTRLRHFVGALVVLRCGTPDAFHDKCFAASAGTAELLAALTDDSLNPHSIWNASTRAEVAQRAQARVAALEGKGAHAAVAPPFGDPLPCAGHEESQGFGLQSLAGEVCVCMKGA